MVPPVLGGSKIKREGSSNRCAGGSIKKCDGPVLISFFVFPYIFSLSLGSRPCCNAVNIVMLVVVHVVTAAAAAALLGLTVTP